MENFETLITNIEKERPFCTLITGDFNAHSKDWYMAGKTDTHGSAIQTLFANHGIFQLVDQPTFITKIARTCIDLVATDQPNLILTTKIYPSLHTNSHHQVNFTKVNIKCPPPLPINEGYGITAEQTSMLSKNLSSNMIGKMLWDG